MKFRDANLILDRLNEGQKISAKEDPENITLLEGLKLIKVKYKKVVLTHEGRRAAETGVKKYLDYRETEQEILNFSPEKCRTNGKILLLIFFLLCTLFLAAVFTDVSLPAIFKNLFSISNPKI